MDIKIVVIYCLLGILLILTRFIKVNKKAGPQKRLKVTETLALSNKVKLFSIDLAGSEYLLLCAGANSQILPVSHTQEKITLSDPVDLSIETLPKEYIQ